MNRTALLEELRTIAQNGLTYADDPYDVERYERVLDLVSEAYGEDLDRPPAEIRDRLADQVGHATAKVGARAAVFDDADRLLVLRRADDGRWCLPCGFVDPGETPREAAVRETREETGLAVEAVGYVGMRTRLPDPEAGLHTLVGHTFRCVVTGGERAPSREATELAYRDIDAVEEWHGNHEATARDALDAHLAT